MIFLTIIADPLERNLGRNLHVFNDHINLNTKGKLNETKR